MPSKTIQTGADPKSNIPGYAVPNNVNRPFVLFDILTAING